MFTKVFDPVTSYKVDVNAKEKSFFKKKDIKEFSPLKRISHENMTWLAKAWSMENGPDALPTRR